MTRVRSSRFDASSNARLTNTKTSVKTIKVCLGILGNAEEEDKWAQFNRLSKRVYDGYIQAVDPNKTFLELPFELRNILKREVFDSFPTEWKIRYDHGLLEDISNTRLFRLHHRSRLRNRRVVDYSIHSICVDDDGSTTEEEVVYTPTPEPSSPTMGLLPFDPVRQID